MAAASRDHDERAAPSTFGAFISYSRPADGKLAPALQTALQQFAKPWYRLRAIRVFRDDANLVASDRLWSSIVQALRASGFFVLLASPRAAASEWVDREVSWWLENRDLSHLLLVLTEGELTWSKEANDFAAGASACPPALRGAYVEVPRWLDLRFARSVDRVSMRDARFAEVVADLAAVLHGRPKDEIAGEEVRQHRRRLLFARLAAATLAALALIAGGFAYWATVERDHARAQARAAESRALAAQALRNVSSRSDLAALLALEALSISPTPDARDAVFTLAQQDDVIAATLRGHRAAVRTVAVSPDGRMLASAGDDGTIRLWSLPAGESLGAPLLGHRGEVRSVAFTPDGRRLVSGGQDGTVRVWPARAGARGAIVGRHGAGVRGVAIDPAAPDLVASASDDHTIALWSLRARRRVATLHGHGSAVRTVAFSRDGTLLASAGDDRTVRLWSVPAGTPLGLPLRGHTDVVRSVAFDPADPNLLASGSEDGTLRLWDVARHRAAGPPLRGHTDAVRSIAFSADGRYLASGGDDEVVRLWDVRRRAAIDHPLRGQGDWIRGVTFTPDGALVASGGDDRNVRLWDVRGALERAQRPAPSTRAVTAVALCAGRVAVGRRDGTIAIRDSATKRWLGSLPTTNRLKIRALACTRDGRVLASAGEDRTVRLWSVARRVQLGPPLWRGDAWPRALDFGPGGILAAATGRSVRIWSIAPRRRLAAPLDPRQGLLEALAFDDGGERIAVGGDDGTVVVWRWRDGPGALLRLRGHDGPVRSLAFDHRGGLLASGGQDRTIRLWNLARSTPRATELTGHVDWVVSLAFNRDDSLLASGGIDRTVRVWDVRGGRELGDPIDARNDAVLALAFDRSDDGVEWAGTDLVDVRWRSPLWAGDVATLVRRLCALVGRDLTPAERTEFVDAGYARPACPSRAP